MTARAWKGRLKKLTEEVGTYKPAFDPIIQATAELLEQIERVHEQFVEEGSQIMITKVLDRGGKNIVENPLLKTWREMREEQLRFFIQLGLTPAALKKINESAIKNGSELSALDKALLEFDRG